MAYFIFRYTLERFIYSKIRLIYKSIHLFKVGKKEKPVILPEQNIIENVQTEVESWEDEKQKEIEQLNRLEEYRRDFIGNVSHELKTPLFNIQGYVSTLLDGGLEDPTINREYLKRSEKSIERLVKIIEDLDEISQLDSGHIRLNVTRFDIVALTQEVAEMLEMKAIKHHISITVNKPEKHILVEGDKDKIRQVLTNIIDNSIRYGKCEDGHTKITFFDMDENILTEITDNGIGIETSDLVRVFERFYRTDRGRAVTRKGKGLGLAISKHIIEAHQQTIQVRSTIGVGTTFGFTLKKA
ncbi:MAG: cell wall metabolism sensor histidine kinase WalK [Bacteroidales bacterium]|jgi:two-component system phosphate regulon sensor histidine kinase PhoR|nr:cell wall metabolism sensor histidine kinase WalK [Bacteroidales bacterium]